jgi:hypothetical protein
MAARARSGGENNPCCCGKCGNEEAFAGRCLEGSSGLFPQKLLLLFEIINSQ